MAIKKSELYNMLWRSCDELRGGMDASQYKDYVLVMLFVKYVSDKAKANAETLIEVPKGASFDDLIALKGQTNIGEEMNIKLSALAEANGLTGIINSADFSDEAKLGKGKDLVQTVSNLIGLFQSSGLDFSKNRAGDDDLMGDAYEYLMKNFASESGKSKGQFYTPAEVSRIMAKVIGINKTKKHNVPIYDPTCGSGSLLLRALNEAPYGASLFGQEYDVTTTGLAKMNMILHGYETYDIRSGDTLNNPQFFDEMGNLMTFDFIVANPPFSQKSWLKSAKINDKFERWNESTVGVPPDKNGDYAFLLHIVRSLNDTGKGACILPHGVLFRGNAEANIRQYLVDRGYIKGIIGLPTNLFFGTGIPACIIILDKEDAANRKGIFMIDAKADFQKDGNKNRLREQDIRCIVDIWEEQQDIPHYAKFVTKEDIIKNDYNLNLPRYIGSGDEEVIQNIEAHLKGGIPEYDIELLYHYWDACPTLKSCLFKNSTRKGFYDLIPQKQEIKEVINNHPEFIGQERELLKSYTEWCDLWLPRFKALRPQGFNPKKIIEEMGNSILEQFQHSLLVNKYDVYDQLMNYCAHTMQDDFYIIASDGWKIPLYVPQPIEKKKNRDTEKLKQRKEAKEVSDLACDLLPPIYVVEHFFSLEQKNISDAETELAKAESELNEYCEEYLDSYLDPALFEEKLNKANAQKRLKLVFKEEKEVLKTYLKYLNQVSDHKKQIKDEKFSLLIKVRQKYAEFSEEEIIQMVTDKWLTAFGNLLKTEMQRIGQTLYSNVISLVERYEQTLPEIKKEVDDYEQKVKEHLRKMGFAL